MGGLPGKDVFISYSLPRPVLKDGAAESKAAKSESATEIEQKRGVCKGL